MKSFLLAAVLLFTATAYGQIPEPGFENWSASGPFMAPNGWAVSPGVVKSPDAYAGSWALQCKVDTFTNPFTSTLDTIAGTAYTGAMLMSPPAPGSLYGGFAFIGVLDSFVGYYKFQGAPGDSTVIMAYTSHWDAATSTRQIVQQATFSTGQASATYQRFSVPFSAMTSVGGMDTAFVQVMAANPQRPLHMGTSVWVDAIEFRLLPDAVNDVQPATFNVYPNPFSGNIIIAGGNVKKAGLLNMMGRVVAETTTNTLDAAGVPPGMYFARIEAADGTVTVKQLVKQ